MVSFIPADMVVAKLLRARWAVWTVLAALIALVGGFLWVAPVLVGFVGVVAGAIAWCIWLERHPEPPHR